MPVLVGRIVGPRLERKRRSRLFLVIHQTVYAVDRLAGAGGKAFRLNKGDGTSYDVTETPFGAECDCPDFVFRRDGLDPAGCKHIQALVAEGLIDAEGREADPGATVR